ncbi:YrdB family protein [Bacillus spongiae]|uniref:YrdB family protein n=1 Tax=Bacillus spongiae TaxID=2683610 RepID=A0ABU8HBK9_9BACI
MKMNLAIRFFLELITLIAVAYWGYEVGGGGMYSLILAIGGPLLIAIIWGMFIAPTSPITLPLWMQLGLEAFIFGFAFWALCSVVAYDWAILFGGTVIVNRVLMIVWKQQKNDKTNFDYM